MKFLCLGYLNTELFDPIPEDQKSDLMKRCFAQCIPFRETGKVRQEEALQPINQTKCVSAKGGKPTVTDGPFLETKEQLGAFFVIEADTIEEAIEVASLHPGACMGEEYGFAIEIRPIQE
jgi:hypothetical protein